VVLGGPNGAGKSTVAPNLVRDLHGVTEYVNADAIALGLSAFDPARAAMAAGRVLLERVRGLADERRDFAFETTLASRGFAPWLDELRARGVAVHVLFLALPSVELAITRVAGRVRLGGHDIPEDVIRRRFERGLENLLTLYAPLATTWQAYDSSDAPPRVVVDGGLDRPTRIHDAAFWAAVREGRP
jgi:predicted ABC-type ATPase